MILDKNKKTVFILGAGASKPYGMPLGNELNVNILRQIQNNGGAIKSNFNITMQELKSLEMVLEDGHYPTIDALLEKKPKLRRLGSILIALALLPMENTGTIRSQRDWYEPFFEYCRLFEIDCPLTSVVTFNYDRSLQYFLKRRIGSLPDIEEERANALLTQMKIVQPHGSLGSLDDFAFGAFTGASPTNASLIHQIADRLKIISDDLRESEGYLEARQCIADAEQIVVLGFGYATPTLESLFHGFQIDSKMLYLCQYGLSEEISEQTAKFFSSLNALNVRSGSLSETANTFLRSIVNG